MPEPLALVRDFLNTLDLETFGEHAAKPAADRERLASARALGIWLAQRGLIGARRSVSDDDLAQALALRAALRSMLRAKQSLANDTDRNSLRVGDRVTDSLPLVAELGRDGRPRLVPTTGGAPGALARILAEVLVGAADGTLARLKVCSAEDCQFVFYDHSRSRTARWCSMETCGNRVKTRRYRHRHR
jgi:predicted RNA-binding Zn ribbon-like protein